MEGWKHDQFDVEERERKRYDDEYEFPRETRRRSRSRSRCRSRSRSHSHSRSRSRSHSPRDSYSRRRNSDERVPDYYYTPEYKGLVLLIKRLSIKSTKDSITRVIDTIGKIKKIYLVTSREEGRRPYACVEFERKEDASAVNTHHTRTPIIIDGVYVDIAPPREHTFQYSGRMGDGSALSAALEMAQAPTLAKSQGSDPELSALMRTNGYTEFDPRAGTYYNPQSHYIYNVTTCLYFDCRAEIYYKYDSGTKSYVAVPAPASNKHEHVAELAPATSLPINGQFKNEIFEEEKRMKKKRKEISVTEIMKPIPIPIPVINNNKSVNVPPGINNAVTGKKQSISNHEESEKQSQNIVSLASMPVSELPHADQVNLMTSSSVTEVPLSALAAQTNQPTINTDINFICSLCKRGFKDSATLEKHVKLSKLHAENLEKQNKIEEEIRYRDRARERRNRDGDVGDDLVQDISKHVVSNATSIESKGKEMLKAMGWKGEGQGLGSHEQGIAEPLSIERVNEGVGLGRIPAQANTNDDRRTKTYKMTINRYKETFGDN